MEVKAIAKGYYLHRVIRVGEIFELVDVKTTDKDGKKITVSAADQFSEKWMESLEDAPASAKVKTPPKHGAQKGDRVGKPKKYNENTGDNVKSKKDIDLAHGGEQEADGDEGEDDGKDAGADVL